MIVLIHSHINDYNNIKSHSQGKYSFTIYTNKDIGSLS